MSGKQKITVAYGDGIGPEIMQATIDILIAAGAEIETEVIEIGEKVFRKGISTGIADESWDIIKKNKVFLKAPITTPQGGGFKSLNVATKTNLGLYRPGKRRPVLKVHETYSSRESANLEEIIDRFLEKHRTSISGACFGVAGPVRKGRCKATNLPWEVSEKKLKNRFKWGDVCLINDLAATANAVPLMTSRELFSLHGVRRGRKENIGLIAHILCIWHPVLVVKGDLHALDR